MADPTIIVETVFLDTQVFVSNAFDFSNEAFSSLKKHIASGRLKLVLTDITVREVKARIKKVVEEEMAGFRKAAGKARAMKVSGIPDVDAALSALAPDEVIKRLTLNFENFLTQTKAENIDASSLSAETVFEKYFNNDPPFGGADKKSEFPDAFVVQALDEWAEDRGLELIAVSGDELIRDALQKCDKIHATKDLAALLDHVAADDKKLSDFIKMQLVARANEIGKQAGESFSDRPFYVADENGDAEVDISAVTLDGDPEILLIEAKTASVEMRFVVDYTAHLSYLDSSTGIYDSEEGRVLFMDRRNEEVERRTRIKVEVQVTFDGTDPTFFEVEDVTLTKPSGSMFIRTSNWDD